MKIFSYTDSDYPSPSEKNFGDHWPVQFKKGFSDFYNEYYSSQVLFLHEEKTKSWLPLNFMTYKIAKFGQILHPPVSEGMELNAEQQLLFFDRMLAFLKKTSLIDRLIQPHPSGITLAAPKDTKWIPFGSYITELSNFPDDEQLLNSYDVKYKKAIQHSINNGARVVFGKESYQDFYNLYRQTTTRNGIHTDPVEYFNSLRKHLGSGNTETAVVYDGTEPLGGIFMLYSKYAGLCTHAGSSGNTRLYGAVKYLHFEMMKLLRDRGVQRYDLVGVRIGGSNPALEGIFRFKRGFGGVLKQGFLWKTDINAFPLKFYDLIQKVRNKEQKDDIIDQESLNNENV